MTIKKTIAEALIQNVPKENPSGSLKNAITMPRKRTEAITKAAIDRIDVAFRSVLSDRKRRSMCQARAVAKTMAAGAVQTTGHSSVEASSGWFAAASDRLIAAKRCAQMPRRRGGQKSHRSHFGSTPARGAPRM